MATVFAEAAVLLKVNREKLIGDFRWASQHVRERVRSLQDGLKGLRLSLDRRGLTRDLDAVRKQLASLTQGSAATIQVGIDRARVTADLRWMAQQVRAQVQSLQASLQGVQIQVRPSSTSRRRPVAAPAPPPAVEAAPPIAAAITPKLDRRKLTEELQWATQHVRERVQAIQQGLKPLTIRLSRQQLTQDLAAVVNQVRATAQAIGRQRVELKGSSVVVGVDRAALNADLSWAGNQVVAAVRTIRERAGKVRIGLDRTALTRDLAAVRAQVSGLATALGKLSTNQELRIGFDRKRLTQGLTAARKAVQQFVASANKRLATLRVGLDRKRLATDLAWARKRIQAFAAAASRAAVLRIPVNRQRLANELQRAHQQVAALVRNLQAMTQNLPIGFNPQQLNQLPQIINNLNNAFRGVNVQASSFLRNVTQITTGILAAAGITSFTRALMGLSGQLITTNASLEQYRISLGVLLKDQARANDLIGQIEQMAKTTPFQIDDLIMATQRLKAFSFETEQIIPMLRTIGDAASASPIGMELAVQRLILAFGQIRAAGRLTGMELRQLTEAGIPAIEIMATSMGKTSREVMDDVSAGAISADQAIGALLAGIDQRFGGMMKRQSQTWNGLMSNLKDSATLAFRKIGQEVFALSKVKLQNLVEWLETPAADKFINQFGRAISNITQSLFSLTQATTKFVSENWQAISSFAKIAAGMAVARVALRSLIPASIAAQGALTGLRGAMLGLGTAVKALVISGGPLFLLGALLASIAEAFTKAAANGTTFGEEMAHIFNRLSGGKLFPEITEEREARDFEKRRTERRDAAKHDAAIAEGREPEKTPDELAREQEEERKANLPEDLRKRQEAIDRQKQRHSEVAKEILAANKEIERLQKESPVPGVDRETGEFTGAGSTDDKAAKKIDELKGRIENLKDEQRALEASIAEEEEVKQIAAARERDGGGITGAFGGADVLKEQLKQAREEQEKAIDERAAAIGEAGRFRHANPAELPEVKAAAGERNRAEQDLNALRNNRDRAIRDLTEGKDVDDLQLPGLQVPDNMLPKDREMRDAIVNFRELREEAEKLERQIPGARGRAHGRMVRRLEQLEPMLEQAREVREKLATEQVDEEIAGRQRATDSAETRLRGLLDAHEADLSDAQLRAEEAHEKHMDARKRAAELKEQIPVAEAVDRALGFGDAFKSFAGDTLKGLMPEGMELPELPPIADLIAPLRQQGGPPRMQLLPDFGGAEGEAVGPKMKLLGEAQEGGAIGSAINSATGLFAGLLNKGIESALGGFGELATPDNQAAAMDSVRRRLEELNFSPEAIEKIVTQAQAESDRQRQLDIARSEFEQAGGDPAEFDRAVAEQEQEEEQAGKKGLRAEEKQQVRSMSLTGLGEHIQQSLNAVNSKEDRAWDAQIRAAAVLEELRRNGIKVNNLKNGANVAQVGP